MQASLRAAVFTVVDEHERTAGVHVPNPAALAVKHDAVGKQTRVWFVVFARQRGCTGGTTTAYVSHKKKKATTTAGAYGC